MKSLVRVFGEHEPGEQSRRLFCVRNLLVDLVPVRLGLPASIFSKAPFFDIANRFEIHFAISAIQKWKLPGQSFTKEITRDLARLINLRQCEARKLQSCRRATSRNLCLDVVPTTKQIAPEFFIGPRALYLIENKLVVLLDRLHHLSEFA